MIGYFSIYRSDDEKYAGGILSMNEKGLPVSFKYTTPIKPNKIQKIIYGKNLKSYLASEIIGKQLINVVKELDMIFVNDMEVLEFIQSDKLMVHLNLTYEPLEEYLKEKEGCVSSGENRSIKLTFSKEPGEDLFKKISELNEFFDLFEPFQRLDEALKYICSSEEK